MGFLFAETASGGDFKTKAEAEWLEQLGCRACPLNITPGKIDATGSKEPEIYILGEAAGKDEEIERRQFIGKAGKLLRELLPKGAEQVARWNNVLGCHPERNRNPSLQEITCCRPRVVSDIERYKPKAIWGFGNVPLHWISGFHGINNWRGRRMPVKVGSHTCWYYPFFHPSFLGRIARNKRGDFGSEDERMTWFDLQRAFADLDDLEEPVVHTKEMAKANVECVTDIGQIRHALQWAGRQSHIGLDYETNRKRPYAEGAKILSASVGTLEKSYAFPMHHPGAGYSKKQIAEIEDLWYRFLMHAPCKKRVHSLAFELEWSGVKFGTETIRAQPWEDTSNLASIVNERTGGKKSKSGPFSLEFLVQQKFGFNLKKISNVDRKNLESTPLETVLLYNGMDSKYHDALGDELWKDIERDKLQLANKLAQRRVPTVVLSQIKGVPIDQATVSKLQDKYKAKVEECEAVIVGLDVIQRYERRRGKAFNPFSPPDLKVVFDEMLKCPEVWVLDKYTKEQKFTTEETALDEVIKAYPEDDDAHALAKALINLRAANGTKSKYIDALKIGSENCVVYPDKLVHTNFNTYFAETGRLCVAGSTLLQTDKGYIPISKLDLKGEHLGVRVRTHLGRWREIEQLWFKGFEQMFRIRANSGAYVDCTAGHRIFTGVDWQPASAIRIGSKVCNASGEFQLHTEEVISVQLIGVQAVWDITVNEDHSYVAQGLIHHNSSDEPNLQNFPKREEGTREVRRSIAAKKGELVLAFDYGQIEARVIAMATKDKTFVKALWERWDVHADWAKRLAHEYPERIGGKKGLTDKKVMKDFRTDIKNQWTFPLFFGASAGSVSGYLKIPQDIIEEQIEEFWKMFPDAKEWQENLVKFYKKHGYVECLTGRRRHGPLSLNQTINSPVQGTAAEIVLDAMSRLSEKNDPELQPEINIHDDLTFLRVPVGRADVIAEKVIDEMINVPFKWAHIIPITVEMSMGSNWCDLEEIETFSSDQWKTKK